MEGEEEAVGGWRGGRGCVGARWRRGVGGEGAVASGRRGRGWPRRGPIGLKL